MSNQTITLITFYVICAIAGTRIAMLIAPTPTPGCILIEVPGPLPLKTAVTNTSSIRAAFDVPSLIGLNAHDLKKKMGKPTPHRMPNASQKACIARGSLRKWDMTFKRGNSSLLVSVDTDTGKVTQFFIPSGKAITRAEINQLRSVGNLKEKPTHYILGALPEENSDKFTGLIITPEIARNLPVDSVEKQQNSPSHLAL